MVIRKEYCFQPHPLNACARLVGMIQELNCVKYVTILGLIKLKILVIFSSHNIIDFNACNAENDETACMKCDFD